MLFCLIFQKLHISYPFFCQYHDVRKESVSPWGISPIKSRKKVSNYVFCIFYIWLLEITGGNSHNSVRRAPQLKRKVYNQCPADPNVWELERKLRSAQRGMERRMLGITWRDRKRAPWIREHTKVEDILVTIKNKKWTWAGHVMRRQMDSIRSGDKDKRGNTGNEGQRT